MNMNIKLNESGTEKINRHSENALIAVGLDSLLLPHKGLEQ
jgi:hypothetical protein